MKSMRQAQILELIAQKDIETQNQMMEELLARGVRSTQATLSRDIKEAAPGEGIDAHWGIPLCSRGRGTRETTTVYACGRFSGSAW